MGVARDSGSSDAIVTGFGSGPIPGSGSGSGDGSMDGSGDRSACGGASGVSDGSAIVSDLGAAASSGVLSGSSVEPVQMDIACDVRDGAVNAPISMVGKPDSESRSPSSFSAPPAPSGPESSTPMAVEPADSAPTETIADGATVPVVAWPPNNAWCTPGQGAGTGSGPCGALDYSSRNPSVGEKGMGSGRDAEASPSGESSQGLPSAESTQALPSKSSAPMPGPPGTVAGASLPDGETLGAIENAALGLLQGDFRNDSVVLDTMALLDCSLRR